MGDRTGQSCGDPGRGSGDAANSEPDPTAAIAAQRSDGSTPERWTIASIREAIARVARGEYDVASACGGTAASGDSAASECSGMVRRSGASGAHDAPAMTGDGTEGTVPSSVLLEEWAGRARAVDRMRAAEVARLGAFVLSRVLARRGGEAELEEFLATPTGSGPSGSTRAEVFEDHRLSTRARALLDPADAIIIAAKLNTRLDFARRAAARAIVAFIGLHALLESAASGRVRFERVERLHGRIDDALLPMDEVRALDDFLEDLSPQLSLDQFEKLARRHIRTLEPVPVDPEAPRKQRCVRYERFDDGTARLELHGPIVVLEGLHQRLRAMARSIRRNQLAAMGADAFGQVVGSDGSRKVSVDERTVGQLMFDLLTSSRLHTQVRVASPRAGADGSDVAATRDGEKCDSGESHEPGELGEPEAPDDELIDVFCPTDGDWLRKQAAVTITVPVTTVLGLDDDPGVVNGDVPLAAEQCREAASHATSWFRVLTDPATSIVTDHVAHTYEPTAAMRRTVRQKWRTCTVPGCSQPSQWCEMEHCCRFSTLDPATGGLTVMENLHPMCKHHHQLKTDGVIRLERLGPHEASWVLPMGVRATRTAPPVAVGDTAAEPELLLARAGARDTSPEDCVGEDHEDSADWPEVSGAAELPPPF